MAKPIKKDDLRKFDVKKILLIILGVTLILMASLMAYAWWANSGTDGNHISSKFNQEQIETGVQSVGDQIMQWLSERDPQMMLLILVVGGFILAFVTKK
ncbi:hypothetical protein [Risungbinella massiliensis]|uniref:hypothetical protein n=1 Tax=Risungbinella massiliensis TaxID=1329796 RepID=UPI0005CC8657|nr:hypothetical protein [Risungbinella massiliensis]